MTQTQEKKDLVEYLYEKVNFHPTRHQKDILDSAYRFTLVAGGEVDLAALKAAGVVNRNALRAKVIASGKIDRPLILRGVGTTAGARKAIEQAGGRVED